MSETVRNTGLFAIVGVLILITGFVQSWNSALLILNMGLISAIMALGVNLQWGFAGLFNVGIMGFVALGGLAAVLVSMPPVPEAWTAGRHAASCWRWLLGSSTIWGAMLAMAKLPQGRTRVLVLLAILVGGFFVYRAVFDPAVERSRRSTRPPPAISAGSACRSCWPGRWAGCWLRAPPG